MATADDYAAWIVQNAAKRGMPDFDTVAQAYQEAKAEESQAATQAQLAPLEPTEQQGRGIIDTLQGVGETALTLGTGAVGGTVGMITGAAGQLGREILSGEFGTPDANRRVMEAAGQAAQNLTYAPRGEAGQENVQAIGGVLQGLPAFVPVVGPIGAVARSAQATAPLAQATTMATAQRAGQLAQRGAQAAGRPIQAAREMMGMTPSAPTTRPTAGSVGAAATPEALRRVTTAQSLPVPVELTRGAALRDAEQLTFEKAQIKQNLGGPLRARAEENNLQLLGNFDVLENMTDAQLVDLTATGGSVVKALSQGLADAKNQTRAAYQAARKSPEAQAEVLPDTKVNFDINNDGTMSQVSLLDYLNSKPQGVPSSGVTDSIRAIMRKLDIATQDANGNLIAKPATVGKMEDLRREISGIAKYDDAPGIRDETIVKKLIDLQTEPEAGTLFKKARTLREAQARKFENREIVARLIKNRKNMDDPKVAADQVFQKSIVAASPEEITFLKRVLLTSGEDGKQAWKELQGATVRYIRDETTKGMGMDSNDRPLVSPAKLHQTVRKLDANNRLDIILGKKNAQTVRDLNDVARYVSTVPPGTIVNTSDTANSIMAAIAEAGATGALTGLPLPVATGLRQIVKMRNEGKTKAQINDALNALPSINQ